MSAILSQEPVSGETLLLEDEGSSGVAEQVIEASRKNYVAKRMTKEMVKRRTKRGQEVKKQPSS